MLGITPWYEKTVDRIDLHKENESYTLHIKESNEDVTSDAVVLTIPVPQLLNLQGNIQTLLEPYRVELNNVTYSSRYALGLYFNGLSHLDIPWDCKYVDDNECIRFIGIDNAKRAAGMCFEVF